MLTNEKQRKFLFKRLPQRVGIPLPGCGSRHKSRHHVAIAAPPIRRASYPAKNPAILAGYTGHSIRGKGMALMMGMHGESVVKESLTTAEVLQARDVIEKQAMREGDGK